MIKSKTRFKDLETQSMQYSTLKTVEKGSNFTNPLIDLKNTKTQGKTNLRSFIGSLVHDSTDS